MKRFYEGIKEIPGVKIYGDFSSMDRCAVVSLNIRDYDSGEVSDALLTDYGISTRSGGHCAPLMHEALGTVEQGLSDSVFPTITQRKKWIRQSGQSASLQKKSKIYKIRD